ncbi:MAG TPA: IPT/TIG domain-containing protein [Bryobacteraceae bacterium]|nr:IPT/TIG domain-containing protein [Bryobacteraceae bacterium]
MKLSLLVSMLLAAGFAAHAQSGNPRMTSVDPDTGKRGDVITVNGENLGKAHVAKLYLTDGGDGKNDVEVQITEQTETSIKFKIPAKAISGRLALMILTTTKPAQYVEEPVKLTIEDGTAQR